MNNKDLIRQYASTGAILPKHQVSKLPSNILKTYLRNRMIQFEGDNYKSIMGYEYDLFDEDSKNKIINLITSNSVGLAINKIGNIRDGINNKDELNEKLIKSIGINFIKSTKNLESFQVSAASNKFSRLVKYIFKDANDEEDEENAEELTKLINLTINYIPYNDETAAIILYSFLENNKQIEMLINGYGADKISPYTLIIMLSITNEPIKIANMIGVDRVKKLLNTTNDYKMLKNYMIFSKYPNYKDDMVKILKYANIEI